MTNLADKARLKQKMLGVRIQAARVQTGLDLADVAEKMGISPKTLTQYEQGQAETSLPELEALAHICHVPVTYFWSNGQAPATNLAKRISIRQKMIGARLGQMRQKAGQSQAELAKAIGSSAEQIAAFERGEQVIPFATIEAIAHYFDTPLAYFLDTATTTTTKSAPVSESSGEPHLTSQAPTNTTLETKPATANTLPADIAWLTELPEAERVFLADPANLLYLRLSMKLHNLSADTLRKLAEGILEITY